MGTPCRHVDALAERPDTWRDGARPAQRLRAVARPRKERSGHNGVSAGQFNAARAALGKEVRVVEISANDAWIVTRADFRVDRAPCAGID
jgi:agmatine/peptidylarginine deiminase